MGGGFSKFPPIIQYDPLPASGAVDGISVGQSQGCKQCRLTVAKGISASSAKIYREQGTISFKECNLFATDSERVDQKQLAFAEYKTKLLAGKYFQQLNNGYCSQILFNNSDLANVTAKTEVPWSKALNPSIRKLTSGGGYSSITKLFVKPSIPFNITFVGQTISVQTMTLFHPCPVRIENIQYDAVLTLGDPADDATRLVVMIPLQGSLSSGPSGAFLSKIASYIPGILTPDPATGQYKQIDIPTGNDWDLSKVFPGTPSQNQTVVDTGYFVWTSVPAVQSYLRNTITTQWIDTLQYGWKPDPTAPGRNFIMLEKPVLVNPFDLQTIRMLPATPAEDAIPPPFMSSLVFKPSASCKSRPVGRETFQSSCDPLANLPQPPGTRVNSDTIIALVLGILGVVSVFLGIYFALRFATGSSGDKVKEWGSKLGKMFAGLSKRVPVPVPITEPEPEPEPEKPEPATKVPEPLSKSELPIASSMFEEPKLKPGEEFAFQNPLRKKIDQMKKESKQEQKKLDTQVKDITGDIEKEKKELAQKIKDRNLSPSEQKIIQKRYNDLTSGEYLPTPQEKEGAAGVGLLRQVFEQEPKPIAAAPPSPPGTTRRRRLAREDSGDQPSASEGNVGRMKTKRLPTVRPPPVQISQKTLESIGKIKELRQESKEEEQRDLEEARQRIDAAKTEAKAKSMKEQLELIHKKQDERREDTERALSEAQARLKQSQVQLVKPRTEGSLLRGRGKRQYKSSRRRLSNK